MTKLLRTWLGLTTTPTLRLYRGFGRPDRVVVQGHALRRGPTPRTRYGPRHWASAWATAWANAWGVVRLFAVQPWAGVPVQVRVGGHSAGARTDADGFFRLEIELTLPLPAGWHPARAELLDAATGGVLATAEAEVHVPYETPYAFISDIDDTFLVSHSATRWRRLRELLGGHAWSRRAFAGAVAHYAWLGRAGQPATAAATAAAAADGTGSAVVGAGAVVAVGSDGGASGSAGATAAPTNAFFYVSSSEWNLYDFLVEFAAHNGLPKGVFQLSQLKRLGQLLGSGQGKHTTKLDRIVRVLEACPGQQFGLLGDDAQQDPGIYALVARRFPGRIRVVYLRQVHAGGRAAAEAALAEIAAAGVATCYFAHSADALRHSQGLHW